MNSKLLKRIWVVSGCNSMYLIYFNKFSLRKRSFERFVVEIGKSIVIEKYWGNLCKTAIPGQTCSLEGRPVETSSKQQVYLDVIPMKLILKINSRTKVNITKKYHMEGSTLNNKPHTEMWSSNLPPTWLIIVGDVIRCIVQVMIKTCNFLCNLVESSSFKLEGVPNNGDSHLPKIVSNSPIPHSLIVIKINFLNPYILCTIDSEFNADGT